MIGRRRFITPSVPQPGLRSGIEQFCWTRVGAGLAMMPIFNPPLLQPKAGAHGPAQDHVTIRLEQTTDQVLDQPLA